MNRHGTPRLVAYGTLTVLGLFAAIVTGRAELAALAAPFALIFAAGLVLAETPVPTATLRLDAERVVEGDAVIVDVTVTTDVPVGRLEVLVPSSGDVVAEEPDAGALALSGTSRALAAGVTGRLRTGHWGLVRVGPVWVRADAPLGLVRWKARSAASPPFACCPARPPCGRCSGRASRGRLPGATWRECGATASSSPRYGRTHPATGCGRSIGP